MPAIAFAVILPVVCAVVLLAGYRLLPKRWSPATRLAVANILSGLFNSILVRAQLQLDPRPDAEFWVLVHPLLQLPQTVLVLSALVRMLDRSTVPPPPVAAPTEAMAAPVALLPPAPPPLPPPTAASRRFFVRLWRGDYELGITFWGLIPSLTTLASAPILAVQFLDTEPAVGEFGFMGLLVASLILLIATYAFDLVALWRSAARRAQSRRIQGRHRFWSRSAQAFVGVGWIFVVLAMSIITLLIWELNHLVGDDPTIPTYAWRTMRGGTEAELSGGLRLGATRDLVRLLRANPGIRVVHLDSPGGRDAEGERLFKILRRNGLDTYVTRACSSACTLAFGGGVHRWIDRSARIGFHQGGTDVLPEMLAETVLHFVTTSMKQIYLAAGFDPAFVDRMLATPNSELTVPRPYELLAARVATGVVGGGRFALSGLGVDPKSAGFVTSLERRYPLLGLLAAYDEANAKILHTEVIGLWAAGDTADAVGDAIDRAVGVLASARLAGATASRISEVTAHWAEVFTATAHDDPSRCRTLAAGRKDRQSRLAAPPAFDQRRRALVASIITEHDKSYSGMPPHRLEAANGAFAAAARRDLPTDVAKLVTGLSEPHTDPAALCRAWATALVRSATWDPEIRRGLAYRFGL